jgi:hypothetical protein
LGELLRDAVRPYLVLALLGILAACKSPTEPDVVAPLLISPPAGALLDNGCFSGGDPMVWEFDWSDVPGASAYHLYVTHPAAGDPGIDQTGLGTSSYQFNRPAVTAGSFLQGWEWRVRAELRGSFQAWSRTGTFNVEPPNTDCP